jgi:predicted HicB family RNase H-like nuclease
MKDYLSYKQYLGSVHFSNSDKVFYGKIEGINDLVTFEADNVKDLEQNFKMAVLDYLETCKSLNKTPEKSYKGSFNVRVSSDTHKSISRLAIQYGLNLNELVKLSLKYTLKNEDIVLGNTI